MIKMSDIEISKPTKRCERKNCDEADIRFELNPEGSYHYGKWICCNCNKYVTWAQKPKTNASLEERRKLIRLYLMDESDANNVGKLCLLYNKPHMNLVDKEFFEKYSNSKSFEKGQS